jgi:hypothetical protein
MRKRRVGVTARSRQNDGNQATGALQFVTEMAAPLELRTPAGTCGGSCKQSADGSMATMARGEVNGQKNNPKRACEGKEMAPGIDRRGALKARMRLCLILRQGASPLSPPAPFPSGSRFQNGGDLSRVRKPRNNGAPLTAPLRSEDIAEMRERGLLARAGESSIYAKGTALYARMRRCLNTPSGGKPPETPLPLVNYFLDSGGPSHGSRHREKL